MEEDFNQGVNRISGPLEMANSPKLTSWGEFLFKRCMDACGNYFGMLRKT